MPNKKGLNSDLGLVFAMLVIVFISLAFQDLSAATDKFLTIIKNNTLTYLEVLDLFIKLIPSIIHFFIGFFCAFKFYVYFKKKAVE